MKQISKYHHGVSTAIPNLAPIKSTVDIDSICNCNGLRRDPLQNLLKHSEKREALEKAARQKLQNVIITLNDVNKEVCT